MTAPTLEVGRAQSVPIPSGKLPSVPQEDRKDQSWSEELPMLASIPNSVTSLWADLLPFCLSSSVQGSCRLMIQSCNDLKIDNRKGGKGGREG